MSVIPCHRGGHICNWPACPQDCNGRPGADAYSADLEFQNTTSRDDLRKPRRENQS